MKAVLSYCTCGFLSPRAQSLSRRSSCEKLTGTKIPAPRLLSRKPSPPERSWLLPCLFPWPDQSAFYKGLPAFCRVVAEAKPTADSDIKIEVWMPLAGWNGKLQGIGNGGFAGLIDDMQLGVAMSKGYAATAHGHRPHGIADRCDVGVGASGEGRRLRSSRNS